MISIGTGFADITKPVEEKPKEEVGYFEGALTRLGNYYKDTKTYLLEKLNILDSGKDKQGILDWINAELIGSLVMDVQK